MVISTNVLMSNQLITISILFIFFTMGTVALLLGVPIPLDVVPTRLTMFLLFRLSDVVARLTSRTPLLDGPERKSVDNRYPRVKKRR